MNPCDDNIQAGREFQTTFWSEVRKAAEGDSEEARQALAKLCEGYWYPLYAYVRRRGYAPHEAQDLTQSFFVALLEKNYLQEANRERGRFRTFLLTSMMHFLSNDWHKSQAQKRGGEYKLVSWEAQTAEERYGKEPFHDLTPDKIYERRWATSILENALRKLREHHEASGKRQLFDELQIFLSGETGGDSYAVIGSRLGMSEGSVKVAVHRLRRSFGETLRAEIAQTVNTPEEIDDELRHALKSLT